MSDPFSVSTVALISGYPSHFWIDTTLLIIVSGKGQQWMLKPVGESLMRNNIYIDLKEYPNKILINDKYKNSNFIGETWQTPL